MIGPVSKLEQFYPGDIVYARFFGTETLAVEKIAKTTSPFPHYFCKFRGNTYLVPMIHMSTKNLLSLVEDGNRLQLELPLALCEVWSGE